MQKLFNFQNKEYTYFNVHGYNSPYLNERIIEIPIIRNIVIENKDKQILEVGNVLSHYFQIKHDVIDKYEQGNNILNVDIVDFKSTKKYDIIVSISTLEHIGWDEKPREPNKIIKAIENLKSLLFLNGKMIITLPLGYNTEMDKLLKRGLLKFNKQFYMKRITKENEWVESTWKDVEDIKYGYPFNFANGLVIGIIEKR